jgi:hypothetical protein
MSFQAHCVTRYLGCALVAATLTLSSGCGDGLSKNQVQGKVTANGQPVTNGTISFNPINKEKGKVYLAAIGKINADGTYTLSSAANNDGAIAGKYLVNYAPSYEGWEAPAYDGVGEPPSPPKSPFEGMVPKVQEIEVKSGKNEINIELVSASP